MKYILYSILFFLCFAVQKKVQAKDNLQFCLNVDSVGEPDWSFNIISFQNNFKPINCLVWLDNVNLKDTYVVFYLYKENEKCEFDLQKVFRYDIKPNWNWFFYKIFFKQSGKYKLVVQDDNEKIIAESILELI